MLTTAIPDNGLFYVVTSTISYRTISELLVQNYDHHCCSGSCLGDALENNPKLCFRSDWAEILNNCSSSKYASSWLNRIFD